MGMSYFGNGKRNSGRKRMVCKGTCDAMHNGVGDCQCFAINAFRTGFSNQTGKLDNSTS
jgi:hypothetical protein